MPDADSYVYEVYFNQLNKRNLSRNVGVEIVLQENVFLNFFMVWLIYKLILVLDKNTFN